MRNRVVKNSVTQPFFKIPGETEAQVGNLWGLATPFGYSLSPLVITCNHFSLGQTKPQVIGSLECQLAYTDLRWVAKRSRNQTQVGRKSQKSHFSAGQYARALIPAKKRLKTILRWVAKR